MHYFVRYSVVNTVILCLLLQLSLVVLSDMQSCLLTSFLDSKRENPNMGFQAGEL